MGFISVLNTTINIIYTFWRQAAWKKKCVGGIFDPAAQKSQNGTLEISKALMESIKHWKYGQKSDYSFFPPLLLSQWDWREFKNHLK